MSALQVAGPYGPGQSVYAVISHVDGLNFGIEWCNVTDRTKDFFFDAARLFRETGEYRGLNVGTLIPLITKGWRPASGYDVGTFLAGQFVVAQYFVAMALETRGPVVVLSSCGQPITSDSACSLSAATNLLKIGR